jgi:hypothetical protein
MSRKIGLAIILISVFFCSLYAQTERGSIYGKVVDSEGNNLPGVVVTLTGSVTAPISIITSREGLFRFLTLAPASDYVLKASIQGFKTNTIVGIAINFGQNVNVNIVLEIGTLQQEVTVTAVRPLIDLKKTEIGLAATQVVMQELPIPRDVWSLEKMAPAAYSRYWNIGGSASLEQDAGTARGDPDHYMTTYAIDGINVSDMSARGSMAVYLNYDAIEELKIVIGGAADVTQQTSGLTSNAIMKRGGNKMSFGARFYLTDQALQATNLTDQLKKAGITALAKMNHSRDLGFNFGFPIVKDLAWFFLAYDYQEIKRFTAFGLPYNLSQWSYDLKLNLQLIPQNRFEAYIRGSVDIREGESPTSDLPAGQRLGVLPRFGNPLFKFQDEHTFGDDLYITAKFVKYGGWSVWYPMIDVNRTNLALWNVTTRQWEGSASGDLSARPDSRVQLLADYYTDKLLGVAHQFRIGGEYAIHGSQSQSTTPGNVLMRYNYNEPTVDYNGDGKPDIYPGIKRIEVKRGSYGDSFTQAFALFLQDTITFKRFNIALGLRYDYQWPTRKGTDILAVIKDSPVWTQYFTSDTANVIDQILPAVQLNDIRAYDVNGKNYQWANFSPRFSFCWDLNGNGKSVLKLSAAMYYQWMGSGDGSTWARGGAAGYMHFWWLDANNDGKVDFRELFWNTSKQYTLYRTFDDNGNFVGNLTDAAGIMYGSYNPLNPQATTDPYTLVDPKAGAPRTTELQLTYEKEIAKDFVVSTNACFRRYDNWTWDLMYYPDTKLLESPDWYMSAGTPPANINGIGDTKEAKSKEWYVLKPQYAYTAWKYRTNRPDYHVDYYAIDILLNKRLSDRWMFNGSFTLGVQKTYYGKAGLNNPTNQWAIEGRDYTTSSGSSPTSFTPGRYDNPLWMVKAMLLYQLPFGVDASLTFNAQEGRDVRETFDIVDTSLPNSRSNSATLFMVPLGTEHSATIALLNFRFQKRINFENFGQVVIMLDIFNLFNSSTITWRNPKDYGKYTVQSGVFSPNPAFYTALDNFGPRIARLGIKFTF